VHTDWLTAAKVIGSMELNLFSSYTLPWRGQEKLLRVSLIIDVVELIELLKHLFTSLFSGLKKCLSSAKKGAKKQGYKDSLKST
jgi:hypothetical protein